MTQPASSAAVREDPPFRRADAAETTAVGDRVVLYHKTRGTAVVLNPSGSVLWTRLEAPQRTSDLVSALMEHYSGITAERAESDVAAFLAELSQHDLLVRTAA